MISAIKYFFEIISQNEERNIKGTEYEKYLNRLVEHDDKMREELKNLPELLKHYIKTIEACEATHYEEVITRYADGFRLGVLLGLDISEFTSQGR